MNKQHCSNTVTTLPLHCQVPHQYQYANVVIHKSSFWKQVNWNKKGKIGGEGTKYLPTSNFLLSMSIPIIREAPAVLAPSATYQKTYNITKRMDQSSCL